MDTDIAFALGELSAFSIFRRSIGLLEPLHRPSGLPAETETARSARNSQLERVLGFRASPVVVTSSTLSVNTNTDFAVMSKLIDLAHAGVLIEQVMPDTTHHSLALPATTEDTVSQTRPSKALAGNLSSLEHHVSKLRRRASTTHGQPTAPRSHNRFRSVSSEKKPLRASAGGPLQWTGHLPAALLQLANSSERLLLSYTELLKIVNPAADPKPPADLAGDQGVTVPLHTPDQARLLCLKQRLRDYQKSDDLVVFLTPFLVLDGWVEVSFLPASAPTAEILRSVHTPSLQVSDADLSRRAALSGTGSEESACWRSRTTLDLIYTTRLEAGQVWRSESAPMDFHVMVTGLSLNARVVVFDQQQYMQCVHPEYFGEQPSTVERVKSKLCGCVIC